MVVNPSRHVRHHHHLRRRDEGRGEDLHAADTRQSSHHLTHVGRQGTHAGRYCGVSASCYCCELFSFFTFTFFFLVVFLFLMILLIFFLTLRLFTLSFERIHVSAAATEWLPRTDGSRVLVVTWLLASLVFMSSYSGILTAMLTVPRVTIPIDSLQDLVTQTKMPWRLESGSWMLQYFRVCLRGDVEDCSHQNSLVGWKGNAHPGVCPN